jgi:hypothetical protein
MHPFIQTMLVEMHQDELLRASQTAQLLRRARADGARRCRWLPSLLHLKLRRLRLRYHARRQKLGRRRYAISWQRDLAPLLED